MSTLVAWVARLPHRPLVVLLVAGTAIMAMMGIGAVALDGGNPWFDLDSEIVTAWPIATSTIAVPALWSGLLLVGAAVVWLAAWQTWPRDRSRPLVLIVSLFFLLMSGDELAGLHERLEKRLGIDWQLLYTVPVLLMALATAVVLIRTRRIDPRSSFLLLLGCGAWAVSQVLEFVQWRGDDPIDVYVYLMVPEELLEAAGSALFLVSGVVVVKALVAARNPAAEPVSGAAADPAVGW